MRWLLAFFLACMAVPAAAEPELAWLTADSEARWVPFTLTGANQIRFTATLAGKPVAAILDTGVSNSVLSRATAQALGIAVSAGTQATAIGGSAPIGWVDAPAVSFGGLGHRGGRFAVVTMPDTATGGEPAELFIGRDLLAGYALDIDYDARRFRLLRSGRLPFRGISLPLGVGGSPPIYRSEVKLGGEPARVIIDTGDGNALTVAAGTWRAMASGAPTTSTLSYGVGGSTVMGLAIVPTLAIGDLRTGATEVAIESDGGFLRSTGASARIGNGLLKRYRVLLDPAAGRAVLAPGALARVAPLRSTSGLIVAREPGRLDVVHVMGGSPAEIDGWHAGEAICSVDGTAVAAANELTLAWPVGAAGRVVALGLCGGETRRLMLRTFY